MEFLCFVFTILGIYRVADAWTRPITQDYMMKMVDDGMKLFRTWDEDFQNAIPNFYKYTYDGSDGNDVNSIIDGGNKVFVLNDNGDEVQLQYNQTQRFSDKQYFAYADARGHPFHAILMVEKATKPGNNQPITIRVRSDTGADGAGHTSVTRGSVSYDTPAGEAMVKYEAFQVYGAGDPTICELYYLMGMKKDIAPIRMETHFPTSTGNTNSEVSVSREHFNYDLMYTLLAADNNAPVEQSSIESALINIMTHIPFFPELVGFEDIQGWVDNAPRWCCKSRRELRKCNLLRDRHPAFNFKCFLAHDTEHCMAKILGNQADVIILDGGDIYDYRDSGIRLLASEDNKSDLTAASYYAVVAVKRDDPSTQDLSLRNIAGYKSCHTGVGKTAGWKMPMGWFTTNGIDASEFSGSCAPGANSGKYQNIISRFDRSGDWMKWCQLCAGDVNGTHACDRNNDERYYGYDGAFRCLQEVGDVAFIKHSIITEDIADGYQLLCQDGTRAHPLDWKNCNLGRVPAHAVVTRQNISDKRAKQIVDTLNIARSVVGDAFNSLIGQNLLWSSNTYKFRPNDLPVKHYLGKEYECNMAAYKNGFPEANCLLEA